MTLATFGNINEPFGFELVLGAAERLNIKVDETEVYRITKYVYEKANTVEDLVIILCNELKNKIPYE